MSKTIVCFYPTKQKRENHFLFNLAKLLESSDVFECWGYKEIKATRPKDLFKANVYHINWFDQSVSLISFFKRLSFLLILALKKKKIIWTIHNIISHQKTPYYNKILKWLLLRLSSKIHIMNKGSSDLPSLRKFKEKLVFIPHGDYFDSYPDSQLDIRKRYGISQSKKIILFFGVIQPYKNIDVLIEAFKKAFKDKESPILLICGKISSEMYKKDLLSRKGNIDNIIFDMNFIPDTELSAYIKSAEILVTPYSYKSSLNSGSILLAFSFGRTVICPDIACVKDIQEESDCLYSYHYKSFEDHVVKLSEILNQIESTPEEMESLKIKSISALEYMKKHSWQSHKNDWISLYGTH